MKQMQACIRPALTGVWGPLYLLSIAKAKLTCLGNISKTFEESIPWTITTVIKGKSGFN